MNLLHHCLGVFTPVFAYSHTCPGDRLYKGDAICDNPERVECGERPVCDDDNQNCEEREDKHFRFRTIRFSKTLFLFLQTTYPQLQSRARSSSAFLRIW